MYVLTQALHLCAPCSWVANLKRVGINGYIVGSMDDDMLRCVGKVTGLSLIAASVLRHTVQADILSVWVCTNTVPEKVWLLESPVRPC